MEALADDAISQHASMSQDIYSSKIVTIEQGATNVASPGLRSLLRAKLAITYDVCKGTGENIPPDGILFCSHFNGSNHVLIFFRLSSVFFDCSLSRLDCSS